MRLSRFSREQGSYFKKIFLYIFLISTAAVLFVSLILFRQSINTLQDNHATFMGQSLNNSSLFVEYRIKSAISLAIGTSNSQAVMPYLLSTEYSGTSENNALNDLRMRIGLNNTIHSVFLYNSHYDAMAVTRELYTPEGDLSLQFEKVLKDGFRGYIKIVEVEAWEQNDPYQGKVNLITLIYKDNAREDVPVTQAVIVNLQESSFLQKTVSTEESDTGIMFILSEDGTVISHLDKGELRRNYSQDPAIREMLDSRTKLLTRETYLDGEKYLITRVRNETLNLFFFTASPLEGLLIKYSDYIWRSLLLLLPILVLGLVLSLYGSRMLYAPLSNMLSSIEADRSKNEIELLEKRFNLMAGKIEKLSSAKGNQLLLNAIELGLSGEEQNELRMRFPCRLTYFKGNSPDRQKTCSDLAHLKTINLLEDCCEGESEKTVSRSPGEYYFFLDKQFIHNPEKTVRRLQKMRTLINNETGQSLQVTVGEPISGPEDIHNAALLVQSLTGYGKIYGSGTIITYLTVTDHRDKDYVFPSEISDQIDKGIRQNQKEIVNNQISLFLAAIKFREVETFSHALLQLFLNMQMTMNGILRENSLTEFSYTGIEELNDLRGIEDIHRFFLEHYEKFQSRLTAYKEKKPSKRMKTVMKIKETITGSLGNTELDLTFLAESQKLSPNYLSRIFKEETGQNLTAYIREERIKEAQRKLRHDPEKSIQQIAWECGYGDMNYFSYSFRQVCGVTPTDYRISPEKGSIVESPN